ncbi:hypothetical protein OLE51_11165, partial [Streptococcus pneumoniae]|nr:hypothetical protein [Streptococcus pneumoniae]
RKVKAYLWVWVSPPCALMGWSWAVLSKLALKRIGVDCVVLRPFCMQGSQIGSVLGLLALQHLSITRDVVKQAGVNGLL